MQLNPVIDEFYQGILKYAGMELENNVIVNTGSRREIGDITLDGKPITLPYFDNLKHPEGKIIFHLLNENYISPESALFNLYKRRLVLELNIRLTMLISNLIIVASDIQLQKKVKSGKAIELFAAIGDLGTSTTEGDKSSLIDKFLNLIKRSKNENQEAYLLDIYLKKNGSIDDTSYGAIGKINFILPNEIKRSIEDKESGYKVYGLKLNKKDLIALDNIFRAIFPNIDSTTQYSDGTDNRIFRYLHALLQTSYIVSDCINDIATSLMEINEPALKLDEIIADHSWTDSFQKLQDMPNEIRLIPSQLDLQAESHKLKIDESKSSVKGLENRPLNTEPPKFSPPVQQPVVQPTMSPNTVPTTAMSPEELIRARMSGQYQPSVMMQQPMMNPQMMLQQGMLQPQTPVPGWVTREMMGGNQPQMMPQQLTPQQMMLQYQLQQQALQQAMQQQQQPGMMPQQMMNPQMMQPGMMQPNMFNPAMMNQPAMLMNPQMGTQMMQQPQSSQGIQFNPLFA